MNKITIRIMVGICAAVISVGSFITTSFLTTPNPQNINISTTKVNTTTIPISTIPSTTTTTTITTATIPSTIKAIAKTAKTTNTTKSTVTTKTTQEKKVKKTSTNNGHYRYYKDNTMTVSIDRVWYKTAWCYVADVQMKDYTRMFTCRADNGYTDATKKTSMIAKETNSILVVNGDYSSVYLGNPVIRNGQALHGNDWYCNAPANYSQKTGLLGSPWGLGIDGMQYQEAIENGLVTDSFCFGPEFVMKDTGNDASDWAQRTTIGTDGVPGHIIVVVSEGRYSDGESKGLTYQDCADLIRKYGCTFGVPLDGGGSSTMVFKGEILNSVKNERAVKDFLCFKYPTKK